MKNRRKKLIISAGLQFRYVGAVLFAMLFVSLLEGWIVYRSIWNELLTESRYSDWSPFLISVMKRADLAIIIGVGFSFILITFLSVLMSHKIAGPVYRLKQYLVEMAKGDLSFEMRLRSGDELADLAEEFNKMVRGLREIINTDRQKIGLIKKKIEEMLITLNQEPVSAQNQRLIIVNLRSLIIELKEVTSLIKI